MTEKSIAQTIYDMIGDYGDVSFAALSLNWPDLFRHGNKEILMEGATFSNIVLWSGLSDEGIAVLQDVLEMGCEYAPTPPLVYLVDGSMLNLPLAKSARKYKKPHWLPVLIKRKHAA